MKNENQRPRKCSNGWWEVFNPQDGISHMYGNKHAAEKAQRQINQIVNQNDISKYRS